MSDVIDQLDSSNQRLAEYRLHNARVNAQIDPGKPGECEICGEWSARLVRKACPPCRDRWKLP